LNTNEQPNHATFRYLADGKPNSAMNTAPNFEQLIVEDLKGLPQQYLSEVADFVLFLRRRVVEQQPYDADSIRQELSALDARSQQHLEEEFADFYQRYPKE
jgi:hypothetical protein